MNIEKLTALFRKLGAPDPEGWARSQLDEGIDQLARYVFLREAWKRVVPPETANWIDEQRGLAVKRDRHSAATNVRGHSVRMIRHLLPNLPPNPPCPTNALTTMTTHG